MSPSRGWHPRILSAFASVLLLAGCGGLIHYLSYTEGKAADLPSALARAGDSPVARGLARFVYDDLGGLSTDALESNAIPWKVVVASLVMARAEREQRPIDRRLLTGLFAEYGFLVPDTIENWAGAPLVRREWRPLGIITGTVSRSIPRINVEVGNLGCASCHAGVTYEPDGTPTGRVWLGAPNTSLDLQAYAMGVYEALKLGIRREPELLTTIDALFPEMTADERTTLHKVILPRVRKRLPELEATLRSPIPFINGAPGLTNGVAAMKYQLGLIPRDRPAPEYAFTSIPDISFRTLRSSLLYDGTYAIVSTTRFRALTQSDVTAAHINDLSRIIALFTVPIMGVKPSRAREAYPSVREIMNFLAVYRPPSFPGVIDTAQARAGAGLYAAQCADCHGTMSEGVTDVRVVRFPNRLVPQADMGTDSTRWSATNQETISALRRSSYGEFVDPARTGGYVAPLLAGVWLSAPYFHNGSVPSLRELMHPESRPARFLVGGHRLDMKRVGIDYSHDSAGVRRYPSGYRPWSTPQVYDTSEPGKSNRGHEREFVALSEAQRAALIEYLKLF